MGDEGEFWRDVNEANKARKERNLERAQSSPIPWRKHTPYHWSIVLGGHRLDYWPSTNKFRWRGKTQYGGVEGFIRNMEAHDD